MDVEIEQKKDLVNERFALLKTMLDNRNSSVYWELVGIMSSMPYDSLVSFSSSRNDFLGGVTTSAQASTAAGVTISISITNSKDGGLS
jgi:hypothetical protein